MTGGGPFHLPVGAWTDDTSMALCLADSLVECEGFNPQDQMDRYLQWYREAYLSSTGKHFDIGTATRAALERYESTNDPFSGSLDPQSAGNGSIMRLAPIPIRYQADLEKATHYAAESSRTTHGAPTCIDACQLLSAMIAKAISGAPRESVLSDALPQELVAKFHPRIREIATGLWQDKTSENIRGSGYVVDSLEAAIWCFATTDSFSDAVLKAVNLGDDADTTGAVCGQLAGAFYGVASFPGQWLEKLVMREQIEELVQGLILSKAKDEQ
jgi:ADP-ribosyl-[dinitrogen reductase] hydrolase